MVIRFAAPHWTSLGMRDAAPPVCASIKGKCDKGIRPGQGMDSRTSMWIEAEKQGRVDNEIDEAYVPINLI
jgi:hypothetical protein